MPGDRDLPGTIARSPPKARRTWKKTHDHAVQEYGEGERASRTAFAVLKRGYERPRGVRGLGRPRRERARARASRRS